MSNIACYKRSAEAASAILSTLADGELMELVCENDAAAFAVIYERHVGAALALALRMCGSLALAEDVVQEAFLSLWRSGAHYDGARGSVRSWLLGIVHHRAIDALRRRVVLDRGRVSDDGIEEQLEAAERTEREAGRRDAAREVRAILGGLPPEQSRVIELAYYGGLTNTEIAAMLDAPVGTIKGRMRLGLQKMRSQLHFEQPLW
ncbi:MAG TPA: sigma-70 family RNA polymerase sigma factor [Solirubrobacteraceae bacterium]|jgi:RNA polymerase sigma-70 factor (ECF subfamily)|nr:sigma-70 family RNA polymerase sigma factor [Solirubrobacteraceae bacterium]